MSDCAALSAPLNTAMYIGDHVEGLPAVTSQMGFNLARDTHCFSKHVKYAERHHGFFRWRLMAGKDGVHSVGDH
jgi:hypothetical protein